MRSTIRRRPRIEPRVVIGLGLVVASVGGVAALVATLDHTVVVYTAAHELTVGETVTTADFMLADVRLGAGEERYLRAEALPEDGAVVVRPVGKGELVPLEALGDATQVDVTSVVVPSAGELPGGVVDGARVDVWSAPLQEDGEYGPPRVLVAGAGVTRLIASTTFGGGGSTAVELVVARDVVPDVLDAVARNAAISLVPSDRGLAQGR